MHIVPACKHTYTLYSRDGQVLSYACLEDLARDLDRAYRRRVYWIDSFVDRFRTHGWLDDDGVWHKNPIGWWRAEAPSGEPVTRDEIVRLRLKSQIPVWERKRPGACVGHFRDGAWPLTAKRGRGGKYRHHRRPACHQALAWQDAYREDFAEVGLHADKIGRHYKIVTAYDDIPRSRDSGRKSWKDSRATQWRV